ncbi:hypothetical protein FE257_012500 [Aspergillus nanangensis]|uniref:Uncharacterized protein n=1 Tax=Aspergillus nanangensis TaxID=2582783 RepID=A0AAD4CUQ7_ASPNN|nr:hypothetical protein FE257_012500 [Aspergillus nanangensis]
MGAPTTSTSTAPSSSPSPPTSNNNLICPACNTPYPPSTHNVAYPLVEVFSPSNEPLFKTKVCYHRNIHWRCIQTQLARQCVEKQLAHPRDRASSTIARLTITVCASRLNLFDSLPNAVAPPADWKRLIQTDEEWGAKLKMSQTEGTDGSWSIMNELPSNYVLVHYHNFSNLKVAVNNVHNALERDEDTNQYILILGLPESVSKRLLDEDAPFGNIHVRLVLDGTSAVIKIPSAIHEACTSEIMFEIKMNCCNMGTPAADVMLGGTTTHKRLNGQRAKQPDQCLWPTGRQPLAGNPQGWPTLVIETGVSESLSHLQEDARWWFENSMGETRIVLVISINRTRRSIIIQKWQLAPPATPSPLTRSRINQIRTQPPPRVQQAVNLQQPYVAQEVDISPAGISGSPLVLDFHAVLDRPPRGNEADIVIPASVLLRCTRSV